LADVAETAVSESRPASGYRSESALALGAVLVTVVVWASAFVGIRSAGKTLSPGALSLGRLVVAAAVLGLVVLVRRERLPSRGELRPVAPALVLCGLLWFGAYSVALNAGERRVDAGTAAMLVNVGPILIAILAGLLLGEGFPQRLLAGCAIAFAGVVVIGLATAGAGVTTAGVVLCFLAAAAYAGGVISQKTVLRSLSPLQTIFLCCLIGALACLPFAPQLGGELRAADAGAIGWMLYLGIFPTALAFTTWAFALARTGAAKLGATTYLVPPLSVLLGWLLLSEAPPALALLGGALCLVGVIVARSQPRSTRIAPSSSSASR
jgi:drug/metabolite transporter (DMT)-like permease